MPYKKKTGVLNVTVILLKLFVRTVFIAFGVILSFCCLFDNTILIF